MDANGGTVTKESVTALINKKVRTIGMVIDQNGALKIKIESLDELKVLP